MRILVTGGAGFIGSAVCRHLVLERRWDVLNLDKLTYAANLESLTAVKRSRTTVLYAPIFATAPRSMRRSPNLHPMR